MNYPLADQKCECGHAPLSNVGWNLCDDEWLLVEYRCSKCGRQWNEEWCCFGHPEYDFEKKIATVSFTFHLVEEIDPEKSEVNE